MLDDLPELAVPWECLPSPLVVVDIETNGSDASKHRIVELAVLRLERGAERRGFDTILNPEGSRSSGPNKHGLERSEMRHAPAFREVVGLLRELCDGATMVSHSAVFEERFLAAEFERLNGRWAVPRICTLAMAKRVHPERSGPGAFTLETLVGIHGIEGHQPNVARSDLRVKLELLLKLIGVAGAEAAGVIKVATKRPKGDPVWPLAPTVEPRLQPRPAGWESPAADARLHFDDDDDGFDPTDPSHETRRLENDRAFVLTHGIGPKPLVACMTCDHEYRLTPGLLKCPDCGNSNGVLWVLGSGTRRGIARQDLLALTTVSPNRPSFAGGLVLGALGAGTATALAVLGVLVIIAAVGLYAVW